MREGAFLDRLDRLLLHPWTSRVGAIQAISGAALLAAGLAGGAVTLVFGFPLGWALLTAIGAALLSATAAASAIDRRRARGAQRIREDEGPEFARAGRRAVRAVRDELVRIRIALEEQQRYGVRFDFGIETRQWSDHEPTLLELADHRPHRAASPAYRILVTARDEYGVFGGRDEDSPFDDDRLNSTQTKVLEDAKGTVEQAIAELSRFDEGQP